MKTLLILTSLALLSTGAFAKDRCGPATGNWINAATITCPDNGSGGVGLQDRTPSKCDRK